MKVDEIAIIACKLRKDGLSYSQISNVLRERYGVYRTRQAVCAMCNKKSNTDSAIYEYFNKEKFEHLDICGELVARGVTVDMIEDNQEYFGIDLTPLNKKVMQSTLRVGAAMVASNKKREIIEHIAMCIDSCKGVCLDDFEIETPSGAKVVPTQEVWTEWCVAAAHMNMTIHFNKLYKACECLGNGVAATIKKDVALKRGYKKRQDSYVGC